MSTTRAARAAGASLPSRRTHLAQLAYGAVVSAAALASLASTGCAGRRGPLPPRGDPPAFVSVAITGVVVAPFKTDGSAWDGALVPPPGALERLAKAVGATSTQTALTATLGFLAEASLADLIKPEVAGEARLVRGGVPFEPRTLRGQRDTLTPSWKEPVQWRKVATDGSVRIVVELRDRDLLFDDPMGTFELTVNDLALAYRERKVTPIAVSGQTNRQVLFVMITVDEGG